MILVFGGTTEGRTACRVLDDSGQTYYYSTKGDAQQIDLVHGTRLSGAMNAEQMTEFIQSQEIHLIIDAAHPFASVLHQTIGEVSLRLNIPVIRYERKYPPLDPRLIVCHNYEELIDKLLAQPAHRLLALTGTNTIQPMRRFWSQRECYWRILDRPDSRAIAEQAGFPLDKLRYFAQGEDQQLIDEIKPDAITTKESGESGFFCEKIAPALALGIPVYVVTRPKLPKHYQTVYGSVGLRKAIERNLPTFFPLRTGFTTGATATAATVAALTKLIHGQSLSWAEIELPSGEAVSLPIASVEREGERAQAYAVKDSGDDPDVTHDALIISEVKFNQLGEIRFFAGKGVGIITLPGFDIPVGEPAINSIPRQMMTKAVRYLVPDPTIGVDITISVPKGEELALKTFNPRLGIKGGISIIGTSGVVKPFSSEAFVASIARQVDIALALGAETLVLGSGAKSEGFLKATFASLPSACFVQYGNFIGQTLEMLSPRNISCIYIGIMLGKAVKLAEGNTDTHSRKVVMNKAFLHQLLDEAQCSPLAHTVLEGLTLARELWTELSEDDLNRLMPLVCAKCHQHCRGLVPTSQLNILLLTDSGDLAYSYPTHLIHQLKS